MTNRGATLVAWATVVLTALLWIAGIVVWHLVSGAHVPTPGRDSAGLLIEICVAVMVFGITGGVIASRRPRNPIGWIFVGSAFLVAFKSFTGIWVDYGHFVRGGHLPLWTWAAWVSDFIWIPAIGSYGTFLLLLFPTGHPPSRRWRVAGWFAASVITAAVLSVAVAPGPLDQFPFIRNPLGAPGWTRGILSVLDLAFPLLVVSVALCVASLVVRARRADHVEREQIKWIAFVGVFLAVGFVVDIGFNRFDVLTAPLIFGPLAGIAVAAAIAIQRYRLFDIDRIITRTLGYAIVTAFLGGTFALIVLVPTALVGSTAKTPGWLVATATLAAFGLFRPVRRRVQGTVDRRFNRARYDAAHTIETFGARLREQVDLDSLSSELCAVVHTTMQPALVSLWIRDKEASRQ